jgi:hypothetical protein
MCTTFGIPTSVPAGTVQAPDTIHSLVHARLQRLARDMMAFADSRQNGARPAEVSHTDSAQTQ